MPQFLGIDFFQDASQKFQTKLRNLYLAELDNIGNSFLNLKEHEIDLSSWSYRKPWLKVSPNWNFLENDSKYMAEFANICSVFDELSMFKPESCIESKELIPSSDPEFDDLSFNIDPFQKACFSHISYQQVDISCSEKFDMLLSGDTKYLDEIFLTDPIHTYDRQHLRSSLFKLKPESIQSPFNEEKNLNLQDLEFIAPNSNSKKEVSTIGICDFNEDSNSTSCTEIALNELLGSPKIPSALEPNAIISPVTTILFADEAYILEKNEITPQVAEIKEIDKMQTFKSTNDSKELHENLNKSQTNREENFYSSTNSKAKVISQDDSFLLSPDFTYISNNRKIDSILKRTDVSFNNSLSLDSDTSKDKSYEIEKNMTVLNDIQKEDGITVQAIPNFDMDILRCLDFPLESINLSAPQKKYLQDGRKDKESDSGSVTELNCSIYHRPIGYDETFNDLGERINLDSSEIESTALAELNKKQIDNTIHCTNKSYLQNSANDNFLSKQEHFMKTSCSVDSESNTESVIINSKAYNSLEAFITMRTGLHSNNSKISDSLIEIQSTDERKEASVDQKEDIINKEKIVDADDEYQLNIIEIPFEGKCAFGYLIIQKKTEEILNKLQQNGSVSINNNFSALNPDITRFILNQYAKSCQDIQGSREETYQLLLAIHGLVKAADILLQSSFYSALLFLDEFQKYHKPFLSNYYNNIRRELMFIQNEIHEEQILHPKIERLCSEVIAWFKKTVEIFLEKKKVLIILNYSLSELKDIVIENLQKITPKVKVYKKIMNISEVLDSDIIIASRHIVSEELLGNISLLIEYENYQDKIWMEFLSKHNINHIILTTLKPKLDVEFSQLRTQSPSKEFFAEANRPNTKFQRKVPITLISSSDVIKNTMLLQSLEKRENIELFERNYNIFLLKDSFLRFADIVVDEGNGIVLYELDQIENIEATNHLISIMVSLSLKYHTCWVILHSSQSDTYSDTVKQNIIRLFATVEQFSKKLHCYEIKILYSSTYDHVGDLISDIAVTATMNKEFKNCITLSSNISKHEEFLLNFPCLNSFSAQILLSKSSLRQLLAFTYEDLRTLYPYLSEKVLKMFHKLTHLPSAIYKSSKSLQQEILSKEITSVSKETKSNTFEFLERFKFVKRNLNFENEIDRNIICSDQFSDYSDEIKIVQSSKNPSIGNNESFNFYNIKNYPELNDTPPEVHSQIIQSHKREIAEPVSSSYELPIPYYLSNNNFDLKTEQEDTFVSERFQNRNAAFDSKNYEDFFAKIKQPSIGERETVCKWSCDSSPEINVNKFNESLPKYQTVKFPKGTKISVTCQRNSSEESIGNIYNFASTNKERFEKTQRESMLQFNSMRDNTLNSDWLIKPKFQLKHQPFSQESTSSKIHIGIAKPQRRNVSSQFTLDPPAAKRPCLTYQKVAGTKGQTKLAFI